MSKVASQKNSIRELSSSEVDQVAGGLLVTVGKGGKTLKVVQHVPVGYTVKRITGLLGKAL